MKPTCNIPRRIENDKKRGRTPSDIALDFIRRTCPCDGCVDWRNKTRASTPLVCAR